MKATKIDPQLLEKATSIFAELGLQIEQAINVFLAKSVQAKGFPFSVALDIEEQDASHIQTQRKISNAEITEAIQDLVEHALPQSEIENLTQLTYCRNTFGLSFPVLKLAKSPRPEDIRSAAKDAKERNRYSTTKVAQRDEKTYVICTQWTDRHRNAFCRWQAIFS
ncbi:type II toxin-antitoxin system RelB/DinJ family antitoxin [Vibrio parahaemolyticus]|uniref:type II toxin-antitoxin system RelB/DinJ family antitoxin n=1 Tax=Vibrio parahaemolyticus TaxID=670 RepID=UPI001A8EA00D|nr:type II toxin-antitoxin system RelB/DinJ family antitoxin [Vibrio parahaemolyticus]HDY7978558.1 type II toxin-antitoxin system RelB/DinJ family antitoxin [Vibrio vulnificus]MBO0158838.1 type II toxin-antitoxin system RelB/DinJ family antitoxin [Vibrio parahaemolyticus]MBO0173979.1 type II toxin-antitoxin system RelB/DinJ family antitoxin [Vibrio parahaemolyticus]MDF4765334.1 type II toxin-antitoxin system RelB/DinJ family antitoxin [Vibrio parahaemolyticus]HBC3406880.1 type II toxin-antitox